SSVHPLTLVAGLKLAKRSNVPCICEIRDLWPETFLDFGFTKKNLIIKALYAMEKWIYKKADALIFTMEGGKDYIKEKHWEDSVDLSKVFYINNGVDLDVYYKNIRDNTYIDKDLENNETFKVIYTGSIRPANGVENIIKCARHINKMK
ncbi:glycosyltransferase, partial [human gut metagenome]